MRSEFIIAMLLVSALLCVGCIFDNNSNKTIDVELCKEAPITGDLSSVDILYHRITGSKIQSVKAHGFNVVCVTSDESINARDVLDLVAYNDNTLYYEKEER